jgi:hypothetical protein
VTRGRSRRRGPAAAGNAISTALQAWRLHTKHCHQCHANAGHPAFYCGEGWQLAGDVSRARTEARLRAEIRARQQGTLL